MTYASFRRAVVRTLLLLCMVASALIAAAHVGGHPSIHDTAAGVLERLKSDLSMDELRALTLEKVAALLTDEEREAFGAHHVLFTVDAPTTVYVVRDTDLGAQPLWLAERGFTQTGMRATIDGDEFDVWEKDFDAGEVGLGVNSYTGGQDHYIVILKPTDPEAALNVTGTYPGQLRVAKAEVGALAWADDDDDEIEELPDALVGLAMIQTLDDRGDDAQLLNVFKFTDHPSGFEPDQVVLTWSDDPRTSVTIQWRTGVGVEKGMVHYMKRKDYNAFERGGRQTAIADTATMETPEIVNDPVCHRHTATLTGLEPDTTYVYSVGDHTNGHITELAEFTTAPDRIEPFSFIYMGDAQNGLDRWGSLVKGAFRDRPDAAFWIMAGDLVNRGNDRDDWDSFFYNAEGIYDRRVLVPAIGNHENQGGHPTMYLDIFTLPTNGPDDVEPERAYSFEYSNALFVILDTNTSVEDQAEWLDDTLGASDAMWKFVVHHHPAYSSAPNRDNKRVRDHWIPIYDKHHVDMVLQGHDHGYLRTYPMKNNEPVESVEDGTVYIVSVSGVKMYDVVNRDYKAFGMKGVSTYQVLDIQLIGDRLLYRAYDIDGELRDEIEIIKSTW